MSIESIAYIIVSLALSVGGYCIRTLLQRINQLEEDMQHTVTEPEMRQFYSDKYSPIEEDIKEIRTMQQKLLDLYLQLLEKNS